MRSRRGRTAGLIGLAVTAVTVAAVLTLTGSRPTTHTGPTPSASITPTGPVVYYEILDASGSSLMERRLDGHSLPRRVAERTEVDYGRTWTVDPAGTVAIAVVAGDTDQELAAISIADGTSLWTVRTPIAPLDGGSWSADGRSLALTTAPQDNRQREALVVDVTSGRFLRATIPDDASIQGFDRDGALILRDHRFNAEGDLTGWGFLRVDPGGGLVQRLTTLPDVGPAGDWSDDADPATGVGVDTTLGPNGVGATIRLWSLHDGTSRPLATFPSVDRIAIEPGGTGLAVSEAQTIRFIGFDGRASEVYSSADPIADFGWSAGGDYIAVSTDRRGPNLTVVERSTGRSVLLPQPDAVAQSLFVRVVGGIALPEAPLPAAEPTPTPTPGPSGSDVAGFAGLLSGWVDQVAGRRVAHVERLVPTEAGGVRVAAEMAPIDVEGFGDDPFVVLVPRPASADVLVWIQGDVRSRGWLWDGVASPRPLDLPADWPTLSGDVAWRPDGLAIAASAEHEGIDGDMTGRFVVAVLGAKRTTVVPLPPSYDRLEGWWSQTELRVGHGICTEGCLGRYAYSARLRIADRRLVQLVPADRAKQAIDEVFFDGDVLVLSMTTDDPADDVRVDLPASLRTVDASVIGLSEDGRSVLIAKRTETMTEVYRIDDPFGRAVGGRLTDPQPRLIGTIAGRGLQLDLSPDLEWALATDRVEDVRLVRLVDGRAWPIDRDRTLVWPGG